MLERLNKNLHKKSNEKNNNLLMEEIVSSSKSGREAYWEYK